MELMSEFRKIHQYNVFCVNSVMQEALANYLKKQKPEEELSEFYIRKRDVFRSALQGSSFELLPCDGTYFQLLGYGSITDDVDTEIAKRWTIEHGVASIPISVFYPQPMHHQALRFCFAKEEDELLRAAEKLSKITP